MALYDLPQLIENCHNVHLANECTRRAAVLPTGGLQSHVIGKNTCGKFSLVVKQKSLTFTVERAQDTDGAVRRAFS